MVLLGIGGGIIALPASILLGIGFGPPTLLILGVMVQSSVFFLVTTLLSLSLRLL